MRPTRKRYTAFSLAVILLLGLFGGAPLSAGASTQSADQTTLTYSASQYSEGSMTITVRVHSTETSTLTLSKSSIPAEVSNVSTTGLSERSSGEYRWNGEANATLTYTVSLTDAEYSNASADAYVFRTGQFWTVTPRVISENQYSLNITKNIETTETGYVNSVVGMVSDEGVSTYNVSGANKTVTLLVHNQNEIVTDAAVRANLTQQLEMDLQRWDGISQNWTHGTIAYPTNPTFEDNHTGIEIGLGRDSDERLMMAEDNSSVALASHELFHAHQHMLRVSLRFDWSTEGMAEYFSLLSTYNSGNTFWDEFRYQAMYVDRFRPVEEGVNDYERGSRVFAALDARLRQRSNGEHTLMRVMRNMTFEGRTYTLEEFAETVEYRSGVDVDPWFVRVVRAEERAEITDNEGVFINPPDGDADGDGVINVNDEKPHFDPDDAAPGFFEQLWNLLMRLIRFLLSLF